MKKLNFSSGVERYELGDTGAVLTCNFADPGLYQRFMTAIPKIEALEKELVERAQGMTDQDPASAGLALIDEIDRAVKTELSKVFTGNDFQQLLPVNIMAVTDNGERVITNLINGLLPEIEAGTQRFIQAHIQEAKARGGV